MTSEFRTGVRLRLERASHHVQYFNQLVAVFCGSNPCEFVILNDDPYPGQQTVKAMGTKPVPGIIPVVAGEAIHNLRTALDYVAWALVKIGEKASGVCLDSRALTQVQFPFSNTPDKTEETIRHRTPGVSTEVVELLRSVQPYQAGYGALTSFAALNRIDKHRTILAAVVAASIVEHGIIANGMRVPTSTFDPDFIANQVWRVLKPGEVLLVHESPKMTDPEIQPYVCPFCDITFSDVNPEHGAEPATSQIKSFLDVVTGIVAKFEPHLSSP